MSYTRAEIDAEKARRAQLPVSGHQYSRSEIDAEKARRSNSIPKEFSGWKAESPSEGSLGWKGVGRDVLQGAKAAPGALGEMLKELPSELWGTGKQLYDDKLRVLQNILIGTAQAGQSINHLPSNIRNYLERKQIIEPETASWLKNFKAKDIDFAEALGRKGNKSGDALISSTVEMLPFIIAGGIPGGVAGKLVGQASALAIDAAGKNENPVTAALVPQAAKLVLKGISAIPKAAKSLTPSSIIAKHFGGNLPIEEIIKNSEAAGDTKTGLGRVLQSPSLNTTFENVTSETPFGGGKNILSEQAAMLAEKSKGLASNVGENANETIHKIILDSRKAQNKIKNESFKPVNELAEKENFNLELPKTTKIVQDNLTTIKEGPLYKNNEKFRKSANKLFGLSNESPNTIKVGGVSYPISILGPQAKFLLPPKKLPSIVEARMVAQDLYESGDKMIKNPNSIDQQQGKLYKRIANNIKKEVQSEIQSKGSPELSKADALAMENYKKNYVPFLDKEVHKLLKGEELSENFVRDVIRPGKQTDKAARIKKVQALLPEKDKGLLGQSFLSKAIDDKGKLDFRELLKTYNSLGPRQKKALFDHKARTNIEDFQTLVKLNPEALNHMFNPKTGARAQTALQIIPALIGGYGGPAMGAMVIGSQIFGARYFNKLMTSPKFREKVINKKIGISAKKTAEPNKKGKKEIPNLTITYKKEEEK